jgi:hypothetical protein
MNQHSWATSGTRQFLAFSRLESGEFGDAFGCSHTYFNADPTTPPRSCRLQGFPEDFSLPCTIGDKEQRQLIPQFYRQIGNAASPPCVAAAAEYAVSTFLIPKNNDQVGISSCAVFDLILKASPSREKASAAIDRKLMCNRIT